MASVTSRCEADRLPAWLPDLGLKGMGLLVVPGCDWLSSCCSAAIAAWLLTQLPAM